MIGFCILGTLLILGFYFVNRYTKDSEDIIFMFTLMSVFLMWSIYFLIDNTIPNFYILIASFLANIFGLYYVYSIDPPKDRISIVAKQQSYWGVDSNFVISKFEKLKRIKDNRVEVAYEKESMYIVGENGKKTITPLYIKYLKEMDEGYTPLIIKKIDDIQKHKIENMIFQKMKYFMETKLEIYVDYAELLEKFDYRADFFLMYLWDVYSKRFNIGIGQLESLVTDNIYKQEFINAIDNMNLSSVKKKGSYLQYKYAEFLSNKVGEKQC